MGKSYKDLARARFDGERGLTADRDNKTRGRIPLQTVDLMHPDDSYEDTMAYLAVTHSDPNHGMPDDYQYENQ